MPFVHLHVHTEYSMLDGHSRIKKLVAQAAELKQPALAITDHGVMYGVVQFYQAAQKAGIKPIIGMEAYIARRSRFDREADKDRGSYHLTLLAQDQTGYQNLLKLASIAQLEGFYYKPRIDLHALGEHAEGLIVTSGCMQAPIPQAILRDNLGEARRLLGWYKEHFPGRFFIEMQWHDIPELHQVNRQLLEFKREFDLPLVATNDVHYVKQSDASAQDILLCIGTNSLISDPNRMRMSDQSYYLKSDEEMIALFGELPEALSNTMLVAELCDVKLDFGKYHLPLFDVPEGHDPQSYLRKLCEDGLRRNYIFETPEVRAQLEHELDVIHRMGFDTYFLIVWDLCRFAHENGIWWNVRGSAAGSMVSYCLGLTRLDPLQHHLIFERFLNPGRITMPDIDLDFPDDRRQEVIDYAVKKYGREKVAQIIAFGTLGARAAIRDVGRAMDMPLPEVDGIAKLVPAIPGKPMSIREAIEEIAELKQRYETEDYTRELLDRAMSVENITRHASTHAAGVVIADRPLTEYAPLHRPTKGNVEEGGLQTTQFEMGDVEAIGLLKVDFLGLSTLSIMRHACELIAEHYGVHYDLHSIPVDEPILYDLLSRGDSIGVFQVEGAGMRRMLTEMKPSKFEHVVAANALFRPGPMDYIPHYIKRLHGEESVEYRHPKLEPILRETFGIIVYQEQIIQMASQLAGYTPGDADLMRRAIGKKDAEKLLKQRQEFIRGCMEHSGLPEEAAAGIFDDIEFFARYGFNKSHAADYALLTCQTAWLKAKYPVEYMTALLTAESGNTEKLGMLVAEARRTGIAVLRPDVNRSELDFQVQTTDETSVSSAHLGQRPDSSVSRKNYVIRFGLAAIKGVGEGPVQVILEARRKGGPFNDLEDFCHRVDLRRVNRRALEALVKVGGLKSFGNRSQILPIIDRLIAISANYHRAQEIGQMSMFAGDRGAEMAESLLPPMPTVQEVPRREILAWEKELIGAYISEHPLEQVMRYLQGRVNTFSSDLGQELVGSNVTMAGVVISVRQRATSKGDMMAYALLEDLQGTFEVTIFPRTWKATQELWKEDKILIVGGRIDAFQGGEPKLICETVTDKVQDIRPRDAEGQPVAAGRANSVPNGRAAAPKSPGSPISTTNGEANLSGIVAPVQSVPQPSASPSAAPTRPVETKKSIPPLPAPHLVQVIIRRSGDPNRDIERVKETLNRLREVRGSDRFELILEGAPKSVALGFPNETTDFSAALEQDLTRLLGEGCIRVGPFQPQNTGPGAGQGTARAA